MAASGHAPTASEYFQHHLQNLTHPIGDGPFWVLNLDTIVVSLIVGILGFGFLFYVARKATAKTPNRVQAAIEILFEMVENQAKQIVPDHDRSILAPLALTLFFWIFTMNAMDFVPVDLLPKITQQFGIDYFKAVPTADLNTTFALSLSVVVAIIFFSIKVKGVGGYVHELLAAPFGGNPLLWIPNLLMNIIELFSKALSLGMRLFCNMYAGELVFLLIALLGGAISTISAGAVVLFLGQVVLESAWAIFHILIILLQAYIFMMLSVIYIGLAHESH